MNVVADQVRIGCGSGRNNTKRSAKIWFCWVGFFAIASLLVVAVDGCAGRGSMQDNPSARQKFVYASAYSTDDCQAKMNQLAGSDVKMIEDDTHLLMSIFSLGIAPSHQCIGVAPDIVSTSPVTAK